jgi:hypothetical protein
VEKMRLIVEFNTALKAGKAELPSVSVRGYSEERDRVVAKIGWALVSLSELTDDRATEETRVGTMVVDAAIAFAANTANDSDEPRGIHLFEIGERVLQVSAKLIHADLPRVALTAHWTEIDQSACPID